MKTILLGIAAFLLICTPVQATPLLSDNFNTEELGLNYEINYDLDNWLVSEGTIDVIGTGSNWDYFDPAYGHYVDMDGSTRDAGRLTSNMSFGPGTYTISYDLAGSRRGDHNALAIVFGGFGEIISMGSSEGWTTYVRTVTLTSASNLVFDHEGGDNIGLLLDNVVVESAPIPEPATMILFGLGILGLAGINRKLFKK